MMQAPPWWGGGGTGTPYQGMPQNPYTLDEALLRIFYNDPQLQNAAAAAGQSPADYMRGRMGTDPGEIARYMDLGRTMAPSPGFNPQSTVDLQRLWNDAHYRQQQTDLQVAQLAANPRNFIQYFLSGGQAQGGPASSDPAAVGSWFQNSPRVQQSFANVGLQPQVNASRGGAAATMGPESLSGGGGQAYNGGTNPLFSFISGRHQNVRDWDQMNPTDRALNEAAASFSGQDPADWNADRERHRPQGYTAGASRWR